MIQNEINFSPAITPAVGDAQELSKTIYFDIETTGLSAQSSYVYLIGCAYFSEGAYHLLQWMTTDPSEEKELIRRFFEFLSGFSVLVHYNGTGFDLPFLEKKSKRHCLASPLSQMESVDLYKVSQKLKKYFPVENLKLKTMEKLFGLSRTDTFSGGDLIEVYAQFLGLYRLNSMTHGNKEEEVKALTHVLLLHNAEDVMNLPSLTVLQSLLHLPDCLKDAPVSVCRENYFYVFSAPVPFCFPKTVTLQLPFDGSVISLEFPMNKKAAELCLTPYHGELKHFYPNVSDYFYLPAEDCAMHKSIAMFVEKEFRKKATAATCYTRREDDFLPYKNVPASNKKEAENDTTVSLPCFLHDYKSGAGYTPLTNELLENPKLLLQLCSELLKSYFETE